MDERQISEAERMWAREVLRTVENWRTASEMVSPNVEILPGINVLVRALIPLFGMVTSDPMMSRCYAFVPRDMKCHKCGAAEPWKDASRDEVKETLEKLSKL